MADVLLVADASWVANEVKAALSVGDWNLAELSDSTRALEVVQETGPDVLIVDMQVGSMGGMAVIRAIRGEVAPQHRPRMVLLLDRAADRFLAGRAGADACVQKPIDTAELRNALAQGSESIRSEEE